MDRDRLDSVLSDTFGGTAGERRVVVRAALDLHDSGRYAAVRDHPATAIDLRDELEEAPDDLGLVERWNWWIGALELAHEGFDEFRIRRWREG